MTNNKNITQWFGVNLAELLAQKIAGVRKDFDAKAYISFIRQRCESLSYSKRVELHATALKTYLPSSYPKAVDLLMSILGEENPYETGMFTQYYWVLPIAKFVELYGLKDLETSLHAIAEITKRGTGEYAIRPYIREHPKRTMAVMLEWSSSKSFHLRRLASEGCRPKLPWATKLDVFVKDPQPVFAILRNLMQDEVKFVQRSVANNIADYLKVNKPAATAFIKEYQESTNTHTQWILKHATRKISV